MKRRHPEPLGQCGQCKLTVSKMSVHADVKPGIEIPYNRLTEYSHAQKGTKIYAGPDLDAATAGIFIHEQEAR